MRILILIFIGLLTGCLNEPLVIEITNSDKIILDGVEIESWNALEEQLEIKYSAVKPQKLRLLLDSKPSSSYLSHKKLMRLLRKRNQFYIVGLYNNKDDSNYYTLPSLDDLDKPIDSNKKSIVVGINQNGTYVLNNDLFKEYDRFSLKLESSINEFELQGQNVVIAFEFHDYNEYITYYNFGKKVHEIVDENKRKGRENSSDFKIEIVEKY